MIELINITHHYGIKPTLRNVNLTVNTGELLCVMGPNGMGKSTLLSIAAGLFSPIQGEVKIPGKVRRSTIETEKAIRRKIVYLSDSPWLPPSVTGREYLFAIGRMYRVEEDRLFDHVDKLLDLFDLTDNADSDMSGYSTGQKKKIGICGALVTESPVMILDEPFSGGLDSSALRVLHQFLAKLAQRQDITIMMAVPVPELVEDLAHRIAIIKDGQIAACATAEELKNQTQTQTLSDALEQIIHPDGNKHVDDYFEVSS